MSRYASPLWSARVDLDVAGTEHSTGDGTTSEGAGAQHSSAGTGTDRSENDDVFSRPAPCPSFEDLGQDDDDDISDCTGIIEEVVQDDYVYAFRMPIEEKREGEDMDLPIRYTVVKGQKFFELSNLLIWLKYDKVWTPDHGHVAFTLHPLHGALCLLSHALNSVKRVLQYAQFDKFCSMHRLMYNNAITPLLCFGMAPFLLHSTRAAVRGPAYRHVALHVAVAKRPCDTRRPLHAR